MSRSNLPGMLAVAVLAAGCHRPSHAEKIGVKVAAKAPPSGDSVYEQECKAVNDAAQVDLKEYEFHAKAMDETLARRPVDMTKAREIRGKLFNVAGNGKLNAVHVCASKHSKTSDAARARRKNIEGLLAKMNLPGGK